MKRSEIIKLYVTEYETNPKTGKRKAVSRYIGPWYTMDKSARRRSGILCLVCWVMAAAAFATAGLIPTWAGLCGYVMPWYALCLLPLFYLISGTVKLLRLKEKFTQVDLEDSQPYIVFSGLGLLGLGLAWGIATGIFLVLNRPEMTMPQEMIYLGCGCLTAVAGLIALLTGKRLKYAPVEEEKQEE